MAAGAKRSASRWKVYRAGGAPSDGGWARRLPQEQVPFAVPRGSPAGLCRHASRRTRRRVAAVLGGGPGRPRVALARERGIDSDGERGVLHKLGVGLCCRRKNLVEGAADVAPPLGCVGVAELKVRLLVIAALISGAGTVAAMGVPRCGGFAQGSAQGQERHPRRMWHGRRNARCGRGSSGAEGVRLPEWLASICGLERPRVGERLSLGRNTPCREARWRCMPPVLRASSAAQSEPRAGPTECLRLCVMDLAYRPWAELSSTRRLRIRGPWIDSGTMPHPESAPDRPGVDAMSARG